MKVELDDDLPKHICAFCTRKLKQAHEFKQQCEHTDKRLRQIFASPIEIITNDPNEKSFDEHTLDFQSNRIYPTAVKDCSLMTGVIICDPIRSIDDDIIKSDPESADEPQDEYEEVEVHFMADEDNQVNVAKSDSGSNVEYETTQGTQIKDERPNEQEIDKSKNSIYYILNDMLKCEPEENSALIADADDDNEVFKKFIIEENDEGDELDEDYDDSDNELLQPKHQDKLASRKPSTPSPFSCPYCSAGFYTQKDLRLHKKNHGKDRFPCSVCPKTFSRQYRLRDHMQTHGDPVKLPCSQCDKTYTNRGNLYRHIRHCHNKEKPHTCEKCGMSFARKSTLRVHSAVHSEARDFECEKCGKKFKTSYYLSVHKRSHVPKELRTYTRPKTKRKIQICICPQCGKKSNTLTLHLNHMRIHSNVKPHECDICSKKFTFKQTLKTHMLTHSGEKPYVCDTCGVSFRQIGHLRGHKVAVHSGLKQHKCQYCGKCFALRSNLTIHERLHTGERPFQCAICSRKFTDSNGLKRHKLSHVRSGDIANANQKTSKDLCTEVKEEDATNLDQFNVSLDQLDVYLDELGNEYTEIIETETILGPG